MFSYKTKMANIEEMLDKLEKNAIENTNNIEAITSLLEKIILRLNEVKKGN